MLVVSVVVVVEVEAQRIEEVGVIGLVAEQLVVAVHQAGQPPLRTRGRLVALQSRGEAAVLVSHLVVDVPRRDFVDGHTAIGAGGEVVVEACRCAARA